MEAKSLVNQIVDLDQRIAELRDRFEGLPLAERVSTLGELFTERCRETGPDDPVSLALVRTTDLTFGLEDAAAAILAPALEHANPDLRHLAGEALIGLAEEGVE